MKIVVFPGVGFHKKTKVYEDFVNYIIKGIDCEGELHVWDHDNKYFDYDLPYSSVRRFIYEAILDFQQVIVHAKEMKVPEADLYIGHSAGGVLALVQENKPCVIFGSPTCLIEIIHNNSENKDIQYVLNKLNNPGNRHILNIINEYDLLAYPFDGQNVENYYYTNAWYDPKTYIPWTAHTGYWESKKVRNKIIEKVKSWIESKNIVV